MVLPRLRQIAATQTTRDLMPSVADEPEAWRLSTLLPCRAGSAVIRDLRAWHGGTPNVSSEARAMPNVEFCAPWFEPSPGEPRGGFRASMPRGVYEALPPRAQFRCARIVADDDVDTGLVDELRTPYIFIRRPPPAPLPPRAPKTDPGLWARLRRILGCASRDSGPGDPRCTGVLV